METTKTTTSRRGTGIIEILLIILIIIVIIVLFNQKRPAGYYTNGYRTTNTSEQNTVEYPTSTSSSTTTTTTTTTGGSNTGGGVVTHTNQAPVITLYGDNPYSIYHPGIEPACEPGLTSKCPPRTDFYSEPGYKATDKEDGDITSRVRITQESNKTPDNGPCHSYNMKYTVTDSNGNTTVARRTVNECNGL